MFKAAISVLTIFYLPHWGLALLHEVLGSFPIFQHPYDEISLYLLYSAFPFEMTAAATVETAGPAFNSYTSTHCGIGFVDSISHEKWSIELEPQSFEGQFLPPPASGSSLSAWNNQGNIRIRRHLESIGTDSSYWQTSKLIATTTAASITSLQTYLRANVFELTTDLQPYTVLLANSTTVLVAPKTSFNFASAVLEQLAYMDVEFDVFAQPQVPSLTLVSPSPNLLTAPLSEAMPWFTTLRSCLRDVGVDTRAQNLGGIAFLGLANRCLVGGSRVYVPKSASEVWSLSLVTTATSASTGAAPFNAVKFGATQTPLPVKLRTSREPVFQPQDLALVAMLGLLLFTFIFLLARYYYRESKRRRVSLVGESAASHVIGALLLTKTKSSASSKQSSSSATHFSQRAWGSWGWGGTTDGASPRAENSLPPPATPNTLAARKTALAEAAQRRTLRLSVLQQEKQATGRVQSQRQDSLPDATPIRPKFPLSMSPADDIASPLPPSLSLSQSQSLSMRNSSVQSPEPEPEPASAVTLTPFSSRSAPSSP